jgi:CRISPR-associated protein Cmr6
VGGKDEKIQVLKDNAEALKDAYVAWAGKMKVAELGPLLEPLITQAQACADKEEIRLYRSDPALFLKDLAVKKQMREAIHNRGALVFWDVFPEVAGDKLSIDILTPHFSNYYKGESPPSDCGQPTPNPFLTVPPGSSFEFHVQYSPVDAPKRYYDKRWKELVRAAFEYALDWMGFGAKTSVGYGQMRLDETQMQATETSGHKSEGPCGSEVPKTETWENALLTWSPGDGNITAIAGGRKATTKDRAIVPESIAKKLFGKKKSADVPKVEVKAVGNAFHIIRVIGEV